MLLRKVIAVVVMTTTTAAVAPSSADADVQHLPVLRVDISRHPSVAAVVTAPPGATSRSVRDGLVVSAGGQVLRSTVKPLSPQDIELVIIPDTELSAPLLAEERASLIRVIAQLPAGARTGVMKVGAIASASGARPITPLSADPVDSKRELVDLSAAPVVGTAAQRAEAALAAFSTGPTVRRTLLLVTGSGAEEPPGIIDHLRRRLAASGTQLLVLDHGPGSAVTSLAVPTGGLALRTAPVAGCFEPLTSTESGVAAILGSQFHVQFQDPGRLPHPVQLRLDAKPPTEPDARSGSGAPGSVWQAEVTLPESAPLAPGPWVVTPELAPTPPPRHSADTVLVLLAGLLVMLSLLYGMGMLIASRREPRWGARGLKVRQDRATAVAAVAAAVVGAEGSPGTTRTTDAFFVFLLPCLNEELVIRASVERLLRCQGDNFAVMVVDDGSNDGTAAAVESIGHDRVWLLRRRPPDARKGKGEALNAAVAELVDHRLTGRDPDRVFFVVVDADGRLDQGAIDAVTPLFDDPRVGGVQIAVRINNRHTSGLARMQDMEFVFYTEIFQRGRRHLGSVGLGGNGQFMRLSALLCLGRAPWSRSLTEDLDLGVRLLANGWRIEYCSSAAVHQQGVVQLPRLVRQRTRWFQGHLQSWRLLGTVVRSLPGGAGADVLYHLSSPVLLLLTSLLSASFVVGVIDSILLAVRGSNPVTWWVLSSYLFAFGPALIYTWIYRKVETERPLNLWRAFVLAHQYVLYNLMWFLAGWKALYRTALGKTGWAKTDRVVEAAPRPVPGEVSQ